MSDDKALTMSQIKEWSKTYKPAVLNPFSDKIILTNDEWERNKSVFGWDDAKMAKFYRCPARGA
jgi:hypothetical protein